MGFSSIKGQDTVVEILKNSIISNHIAHAYLFVGQDGIGKKTTALALAQAVNCINIINGDSCGNCLSCRKVLSGSHPDVIIIKPEGISIKIDQIRNLRNKVFYKCYESKFKVIIFDDAHLFTIEAANSLLKVLEEPPQNTLFILITSEPQQLPDTIISRCQLIQFKVLTTALIKEILLRKYKDRSDYIPLVANLARGSLGLAEKLIQSEDLLEKRFSLLNLLKEINNISPGEVVLWCDQWGNDRNIIRNLLEMVQLWFRDLLVWRTTGKEEFIINSDYIKYIQGNNYSIDKINQILSSIHKSIRLLDLNVNPNLILEVLLLKIKFI